MTGPGSEGNNKFELENFSERVGVRVGVGVGYTVTGSLTELPESGAARGIWEGFSGGSGTILLGPMRSSIVVSD